MFRMWYGLKMEALHKPSKGVAWFSTAETYATHSPLLENNYLEALEWTIDSRSFQPLPERDRKILHDMASRKKLTGHGVHYSVLSVGGKEIRERWLSKLKNDPLLNHYAHLSVHFGFSTGRGFQDGAPLPLPFTAETLDIGRKNLEALAHIVPCRIGLENLALAFSPQDVSRQGEFLDKLLEPFDGFLLLDIHNLYSQSYNFDMPIIDLAKTYPLQRVREIHISGGSWSVGKTGKRIRRDTHDHCVPQDVFAALEEIIPLCPNLEFIFLEQLPSALQTDDQRNQFQEDYMSLLKVSG